MEEFTHERESCTQVNSPEFVRVKAAPPIYVYINIREEKRFGREGRKLHAQTKSGQR